MPRLDQLLELLQAVSRRHISSLRRSDGIHEAGGARQSPGRV